MRNQVKHKYVPCEVSVTEFQAERGFAASFTVNAVGTRWLMDQTDGAYQNEQYGYEQDILNWSSDHSNGML